MRTNKLADLFAHKYKVAVSTADLEVMLRKQIDLLYTYVHSAYDILDKCATADASNPTNEHEKQAVAGHQFCKSLVSFIDYLKKERDSIPLPKMQSVLVEISKLIDDNLKVQGAVQFPHVSALIWEMVPLGGQKVKPAFVEKRRKELANKARHGISRVKSVVTQMLTNMEEMGMAKVPSNRFIAQRTGLDLYDVIDFMRTHGGEFGIEQNDDWDVVFRNDPEFLEEMTTVIYALKRARTAVEHEAVRGKVLQALREHRARTEGVNTPYFEAGEEQAKQMALPEQNEEEPIKPANTNATVPANTNAKVMSSSLKMERLLRKYQ